MTQAVSVEANVLSLFLPEGSLEWFDIVEGRITDVGVTLTLQEKNIPPLREEHDGKQVISKGLYDITITDFPIQEKRASLTFRRRRWKVEGKSELLKRDILLAAPGTSLANSMENATLASFPNARMTTDRFHVQKLVSEALQDMRISLRWKAIEEENKAVKKAREQGRRYISKTYTNGDTKKQLLARSRYLLFKSSSKWTDRQKQRAVVLFQAFPELKRAYDLTMCFRGIYETSKTREEA